MSDEDDVHKKNIEKIEAMDEVELERAFLLNKDKGLTQELMKRLAGLGVKGGVRQEDGSFKTFGVGEIRQGERVDVTFSSNGAKAASARATGKMNVKVNSEPNQRQKSVRDVDEALLRRKATAGSAPGIDPVRIPNPDELQQRKSSASDSSQRNGLWCSKKDTEAGTCPQPKLQPSAVHTTQSMGFRNPAAGFQFDGSYNPSTGTFSTGPTTLRPGETATFNFEMPAGATPENPWGNTV